MNIINTVHERQIITLIFLLFFASSCATQKTKPPEVESKKIQSLSKKKPVKPAKPVPRSGPESPTSKIYLGSDGKLAGRGSPDRPASEVLRIAQGVHPKALSLPGLPKDKFGLIDWAVMVKNKVIKPVGSLLADKPEVPPFDLNILIKAKGDFVRDIMFRHKPHTYWLDCKNCHSGIFVMAKGKNKMSMQGIVAGKWCGRCHGKVSFPLTDCNRCHSQAKH